MDSKLGTNVRVLRERREISRRQLSRAVGVTPTTITRIEAGGYSPRIEIVSKIADVLDTTVDELLGRTVSLKGLDEELYELCRWAAQTNQKADLIGYFKYLAFVQAIERRYGTREGADQAEAALTIGLSVEDLERIIGKMGPEFLLKVKRLPDEHVAAFLQIAAAYIDSVGQTNVLPLTERPVTDKKKSGKRK